MSYSLPEGDVGIPVFEWTTAVPPPTREEPPGPALLPPGPQIPPSVPVSPAPNSSAVGARILVLGSDVSIFQCHGPSSEHARVYSVSPGGVAGGCSQQRGGDRTHAGLSCLARTCPLDLKPHGLVPPQILKPSRAPFLPIGLFCPRWNLLFLTFPLCDHFSPLSLGHLT